MKRPMRVLLLFPSFAGNGGIQRFNRTLTAAGVQSGCIMHVVSIVDSDDALRKECPANSDITFHGTGGGKIRFVMHAISSLMAHRWDVVLIGHVNLLRLVIAILPLTRSRHARTIMVAHGIDVWNCIETSRASAMQKLWRVLAVSDYTRQSVLQQVSGLSADRCVVFPNALSESWQQKHQTAHAPLDLPEKFVLSVTRLTSTERYKGIVTAIESMAAWDDPEMFYVVVGNGNDLPFLNRVAQRCGVTDRVIFLASVDDRQLSGIYQSAQAFLLASGKEGFGIVYLEAMHFGVPVIAARSGGAVDVVGDNETGLLVDYGDVAGIAGAINRLQADSALRSRIVTGGKRLVVSDGKFTEAAMRQRWTQLLHEAQY